MCIRDIYELLHPYSVDFRDWVSAPTAGGNVMVLILAALLAAAVALGLLGRFLPRDKS